MGTPQESSGARRRAPRLRALLPWALLFTSAVVLRSLRFGLVFVNGEVRFPNGADEMYHLRRIWFTVVNFPASLDFDPYLNHPEGAPPIWPPVFDWSIAALVRLLVGREDQHAVEVLAAWVPPLLGALAVIAVAWLARRTFSPAAGWLTGALLVSLPGHIVHSALGMVDHHVAVGLLATLLVAAALPLAGPLAPNGRPRGAALAGAMAAAAILLWPGALLHVLAIQLFLVAQLLASRDRRAALGRARALAVMHGVAAALLLPSCAGREWKQFGAYTPEVLSNFQPLWFAAGAVAMTSAAWLWTFPSFGGNRQRRLASALGLGTLGIVAALFLVPGLRTAVAGAARWFEADPYLASIAELQPLLSYGDDRFTPALAHEHFSYLVWAYPFALAGLAWQARARKRDDVLLLLFVSAAFCAATLYQLRFGDVFAAGFAWVMGPALAEGLGAARRRLAAPFAVLAGAALLAGIGVLLTVVPGYTDVIASAASLRGQRLAYTPEVRLRLVQQRAARWLKQHTAPTQGYLDPAARPEYGVLSAWGHGHQLLYYSERPMVQTNFGPWGGSAGFDAAARYFDSRDERSAASIAEGLGARYVVATLHGSGQRTPKGDSLAARLVPVPEPGGRLGLPGGSLNALARHRLLFIADDSDLERGGSSPWRAAVYEIVPGARVEGRAPGRQAVAFDLAVPLPGRKPVRYRARARVDASGGYEIRLPYPSETGYVVRSGSQRRSLTLSEADVREGRTVAGPSFEPRAGPPEP